MVAYVSLVNWTEQGVKNIKGTVERVRIARDTMRGGGVKFLAIWWTLGPYDMVAVIEAPDDETATRYLIQMVGQGNFRTMTMRAFSEEEMEQIVQGV